MLLQVREILGEIRNEDVTAKGASVKIREMPAELYGTGNWKKMKGIANVRLSDGSIRLAEINYVAYIVVSEPDIIMQIHNELHPKSGLAMTIW
ncbi:MAG: hypothetical protein AB7S75_09730 [Desulfococcaceae bacterium]